MIEDRPDSSTFREIVGELLSGGVAFCFQARGRSMLPTIQDGDILHVATVSPAKLKAGDIVLFKDGDKFKAHRIIRRRKGGFVTRGDAGIDADGEIAARQILGKVVGKESGGKRVIVLDNAGNRVRFFARELRRSLSRLRHRF